MSGGRWDTGRAAATWWRRAPHTRTRATPLLSYDYFSPLPPSPNGWDADVDALAAALPPHRLNATLSVVHGFYGTIGQVSHCTRVCLLVGTACPLDAHATPHARASQYGIADPSVPAFSPSWTVFPWGAGYENAVTHLPVGPLPMDVATVAARIAKARDAGIRVLLYFA